MTKEIEKTEYWKQEFISEKNEKSRNYLYKKDLDRCRNMKIMTGGKMEGVEKEQKKSGRGTSQEDNLRGIKERRIERKRGEI